MQDNLIARPQRGRILVRYQQTGANGIVTPVAEELHYSRDVWARLRSTFVEDQAWRRGTATAGLGPAAASFVLGPAVGIAATAVYGGSLLTYHANVVTEGTRRRFYDDRTQAMTRMADLLPAQTPEQVTASLTALQQHHLGLVVDNDPGLAAVYSRTVYAVGNRLELHRYQAGGDFVRSSVRFCQDLMTIGTGPAIAAPTIHERLQTLLNDYHNLPAPRPVWIHELHSLTVTLGNAFATDVAALPAPEPA